MPSAQKCLNTIDDSPASPTSLRLTLCSGEDMDEAWHQRAVFYQAALHAKQWPDLTWLFHVPNGGYRTEGTGTEMKRQGVRKGVEDVFLDVPRRDPETGGVWLGWRGELKKMKASYPAPEQKAWMAFHQSQGFYAEWFKGSDAMWASLLWYLNLPRVAPVPEPRLESFEIPKVRAFRPRR